MKVNPPQIPKRSPFVRRRPALPVGFPADFSARPRGEVSDVLVLEVLVIDVLVSEVEVSVLICEHQKNRWKDGWMDRINRLDEIQFD